MQHFGEQLRTLRTQRGLTMRELAHLLGYTTPSYIGALAFQPMIYCVETGQRSPAAECVFKISQYFHFTMEQLMRDDLDVDS
ncbi:MAG: helix-turn-helix transcriptional regulator [Phycisphaerales bacterium]|nr:helix-turn-helix transcriptional regulator [Phycisphaerales bacterium]